MRSRLILTFLAITGATACSEDGGPTGVVATCNDDTGSVTVTVSGTASQPVFDWSPACAVALLLVERSGGDTWLIGTDDTTWGDPELANLFTPPITYGVAPATAYDEYGPDALIAGQPHDVILWRVPPGSTADCMAFYVGACMLANHTWTP